MLQFSSESFFFFKHETGDGSFCRTVLNVTPMFVFMTNGRDQEK